MIFDNYILLKIEMIIHGIYLTNFFFTLYFSN